MVSQKTKGREQQPFEVGLKFSFHRFRKLRLYFAWAFTIVLAIYAKSTDRGFWIAVPVVVIGEAIRMWSHGYLRKARELATNGPYAYVRNPLYIGNYLIGLGFCLIIWHPILGLVFTLGFFLVYWVTVRGEEQRLAFNFGDAYGDYLKNVPRFFPRLVPYKKQGNAPFAFRRAWEHGEHITILAIVILFMLLYLRQELYQNHRPLNELSPSFLILTMGIGISLLGVTSLRWFKNKNKMENRLS